MGNLRVANATPYWIDGDEQCPHCLQRYSHAVERRCVECDGPTCPHCVTIVHDTREVVCTGCAPAGKEA
jgi:hypothetical protein